MLICCLLQIMVLKQDLVGSWQMYKDDDTPEGPPVKEKFFFYPDGRLLIRGSEDQLIRFEVSGNQLVMFQFISGERMEMNKSFKLVDGELHLKNTETGFAYYRRTNTPRPEIDSVFERFGIVVTHPRNWQVVAKTTEDGHQRIGIIDTEANGLFAIARLANVSGEKAELTTVAHQFLRETLSRLPNPNLTIHEVTTPFFGLKGPSLLARDEIQGMKICAQAKPLVFEETSLMLVYLGPDAEVENYNISNMIRTLKVDGKRVFQVD